MYHVKLHRLSKESRLLLKSILLLDKYQSKTIIQVFHDIDKKVDTLTKEALICEDSEYRKKIAEADDLLDLKHFIANTYELT